MKTQLPPPRKPVWESKMKTLDSAHTEVKKLKHGKVQYTIAHDLLREVTPEMLVWWFGHFATSTTTLNNETIPMYWLWHPYDHISVEIIKPSPLGIGFRAGAKVRIKEVLLQKYPLDVTAIITQLDTKGISLQGMAQGLKIGNLKHSFKQVNGGTLYHSTFTLGIDIPILRRLVNYIITHKKFTSEMGQAWLKHNIEEVGNFEFFLPQLYQAHHAK